MSHCRKMKHDNSSSSTNFEPAGQSSAVVATQNNTLQVVNTTISGDEKIFSSFNNPSVIQG